MRLPGTFRVLVCLIAAAIDIPAQGFASSGVDDIDAMRRSVQASRTRAEDAQERNSLLNSWFRLLMHQGVVLDETADLIPVLSNQQHPRYLETIDEMYRVMERIQAKPVRYEEKRGAGERVVQARPVDWPQFQRSPEQDGHTPDAGPSQGRIAWKLPVGHAWYSSPVLDESRVYVTSPGITTRLYCLEQATGKVVWKNRQHALHAYGSARMSSSPVLAGQSVVIRGSGQRDHQDSFPSARLLYVDRATGRTQRTLHAGHVDYRRGYSPISGNDRYLAVLHGEQTIHHRPPLIWMLDTLALKDAGSGEELWRIRVGDTFGEPVVEGERVWLATDAGVVYSFHAQGKHRIAWSYQAGAAIRSALALIGDTIYAGDQEGTVYAISKSTGGLKWRTRTEAKQERAFQLFSAATADAGRIYIGAADGKLYCLDAATGEVRWEFQAGDWIRSRPVVAGGRIYLAAMNGEIQALRDAGSRAEVLWKSRVTEHQVLSDLASRGGRVFVTSNDLYLHCLDGATGKRMWRHSLLEAAYLDGRRYEADIVSGGADYQSSPTAADGKVFIGGPNRFVYAVDAKTGKEAWRFEASGQVSGSPLVAEGRVYFGQQGGNREFYAVDLKDGRPVWKVQAGWAWVGATYWKGRIYFGTVNGDVICLNALDGRTVWTQAMNGGVHPSIAIDEERVYSGSWDGYTFALDRLSGRVQWAYHTGRPDSGAPVLNQGIVFIHAYPREMLSLDVKTGEVKWRVTVPETRGVNGSSSAHDGVIYTSDYIHQGRTPIGSRVLALDAGTGRTLWEHPVGGGLTSPVVAGDKVCFGSTEHAYYSCVSRVNIRDGRPELLWRVRIGGAVDESCTAIYGGRAYVLASDRYLYAFE